jgi:site-specific DNA recombinase
MTAADTLIDKFILTPDTTAPNGHKIELFGELGAILSLCNDGMDGNAKTRRVTAGLLQMFLVAGAGFEPAAFRL